MDPLSRLGPLERAFRTKDKQLFLETIESRCTRDRQTGCWLWNGARRSEGYPYIGRSRSQRLAHRAVWLAKMDFVYDNSEVSAIHHMCGVRICVNPEHLSPATAAENTAEMSARNALLQRIAVLTEALRVADPENTLLRHVWWGEADGPREMQFPAGGTYESKRRRARRIIGRSTHRLRIQANQDRRFQQVLDVEKAYARGVPLKEALKQVGIGRSAYYDWRAQLRKKLDEGGRGTG
nr:HNH endonuclease [Arthrobacter zhaoguopingii]